MAKAMFIMDQMPNSCVKCPVVNELGSIYVCGRNGKVIENGCAVQRAEWCPLRSVPEYEHEWHDDERSDWERGYNACIDEILGGGE